MLSVLRAGRGALQSLFAGVLLLLTLGSCLSLGMVANITRLPKVTSH
jgi:hypothetical protein